MEALGLFRKLTSVSTMGAVDFRSDKERIARYTKQTRNATRALVEQQSGDDAESHGWKAGREAAQQRRDRAIREEERDSLVARQERERRERESAAIQGGRSPESMPLWMALAGMFGVVLVGLALVVFVVLEIAGIRIGWWWAAILVPALIASYNMDKSS